MNEFELAFNIYNADETFKLEDYQYALLGYKWSEILDFYDYNCYPSEEELKYRAKQILMKYFVAVMG